MRCEECNTEMKIDKSFYRKEGDGMALVQELSCHNGQCPKKGIKKEVIHKLPTE